MQIDWLWSFVETVRAGSLSKAGDKLNVSQTALSKQIKNLEGSFGVTLFHRSSAGMTLTPEGELFYNKVQVWLREMEDIEHQMKNLTTMKTVVFGCLPSVASYYLPQKVLRLKTDGVQIDIRVFDQSDDVWESFIAGDIDIAVLDRVRNVPKIYPSEDLFSEPFYAVVPSSHTFCTYAQLRLTDVLQQALVMHPPGCDIRKLLDAVLTGTTFYLNVTQEIPFGEAILGFVAAGAGITIVPELIANNLGNANLKAIPIVDLDVRRTVCWVAKSAEQYQSLRKYFR